MKENGTKISCMEEDFLLGQVGSNTRENTETTKEMGLVNTLTLMEEFTLESGKMEVDMELAT